VLAIAESGARAGVELHGKPKPNKIVGFRNIAKMWMTFHYFKPRILFTVDE
jgi:hypothetical protein